MNLVLFIKKFSLLVIGQAGARFALEESLVICNGPKGGPKTEAFLKEAQCYRTMRDLNRNRNQADKQQHSCETIDKYEKAKFILWKNIQLGVAIDGIEKLSAIQKNYLNHIKEELDEIFPEEKDGEKQNDAEVFDHHLWNMWTDAQIMTKFESACRFLKHTYSAALANEYVALIKKIKADDILMCEKEKSSPKLSWSVFLKKFKGEVSHSLRKIILTAAMTPNGIAQGMIYFVFIRRI